MPGRTISVGTSPVQLLDASKNRVQYIIQNKDTTVDLYIDDKSDVAITGPQAGRILGPMEIETATKLQDPALIDEPLYAVAASAINVYVNEFKGKVGFK